MGRTIHVIRRAKSYGARDDCYRFGLGNGSLDEDGIEDAKGLTKELGTLGIDVATAPVAVSRPLCAFQTADFAGFLTIRTEVLLDEPSPDFLPTPEELMAMIALHQLPEIVHRGARRLINKPPPEDIWVTHRLVIAGLAHELDIHPTKFFIPDMASITTFELP